MSNRAPQYRVSFQLKDSEEAQKVGHCFGVNSILHNNGQLYSAGRDSVVHQWDLSQNKPQILHTFAHHSHWINHLTLCHSSVLSSCSSDTTIKLWSLKQDDEKEKQDSSQLLGTLEGHDDYVLKTSFNESTTLLSSGGLDSKICIWDIAHSDSPVHTYYSKDSDKESASFMTEMNEHKKSIYALDSCENLVVTGGTEHILRGWDPRSSECCFKIRGHHDVIRDIIISNDGSKMVTASSDRMIKIWDTNMRRCLKSYVIHSDSVWCLAIDSSFSHLFSGGRDGKVYMTDLSTAQSKLLISQREPVLSIALEEDEESFWISNSTNGTLRNYRLGMESGYEKRSHSYPAILCTSPLAAHLSHSYLRSSTDDLNNSQIENSEHHSNHNMIGGSHNVNDEDDDEQQVLCDPTRVIDGCDGIIKSQILNDRIHILTQDTGGSVQLWDVTKAKKVQDLGKVDWDVTITSLTKLVAIPNWFTVDTKIGVPTVHLESSNCFDALMLGEMIDMPALFRLNPGERMLCTLFVKWCDVKLKRQKEAEEETQRKRREEEEARRDARVGGGNASNTNTTTSNINRNDDTGQVGARTFGNSTSRVSAFKSASQPQVRPPVDPAALEQIQMHLAQANFDIDEHIPVIITNKQTGRIVLRSRICDFNGDEDLPVWVSSCVLRGEYTSREPVKISFILRPASDETFAYTSKKLTSLRCNTVFKIKEYLHRQTGVNIPPVYDPETNTEIPADFDKYYELTCKGATLPPSMDLAAIKYYYWKSGDDMIINYKIIKDVDVEPSKTE